MEAGLFVLEKEIITTPLMIIMINIMIIIMINMIKIISNIMKMLIGGRKNNGAKKNKIKTKLTASWRSMLV